MSRRASHGSALEHGLNAGLKTAALRANPHDPDAKRWWRIDDCSYATFDEWGDSYSTGPRIEAHAFEVVRETPKGVWLRRGWLFATEQWVGVNWKRRFAAPTVEEAFKDYIARRERQRAICQAQADRAERLRDKATQMLATLTKGEDQTNGKEDPATGL